MTTSTVPDVVKNRIFIMYDALAKRPPYEAYNVFRKVIEDENYDYVDYEYWYYRFYYKKMDLLFDRSLERKQPTICELPPEMLTAVMKHLDFLNRARARKVCKLFRNAIDDLRTRWREVQIHLDHDWIEFKLDAYVVKYFKRYTEDHSSVRLGTNRRKTVNGDWVEYAFSDFQLYLKSSRIEIHELKITLRGTASVYNRLVRLLMSSATENKVHFHVDSVFLIPNNFIHVPQILSCLQPGILNSIQVESPNRKGEIEKLIELDQFKQAKFLTIPTFANIDAELLANFYHLMSFTIRLESIDEKDVMHMRENLPNSRNFMSCRLVVNKPLNLLAIATALGADYIDTKIRKRFKYSWIQNDGQYLMFSFETNIVRINRSKEKVAHTISNSSEDSSDSD